MAFIIENNTGLGNIIKTKHPKEVGDDCMAKTVEKGRPCGVCDQVSDIKEEVENSSPIFGEG